VRPSYSALQGLGSIVVSHIEIPENTAHTIAPGDDAVVLGGFTQLVESWSQRAVWLDIPFTTYTATTGIINCALDGGFAGGSRVSNHLAGVTIPQPPAILGGYTVVNGPLGGTGSLAFNGVFLDGDTIVRSLIGAVNMDFTGYNNVGFALIDSQITVLDGVFDLVTRNLYGGNVVYGTTAFDAGRGQVLYPAGAGAAATALPATGTMRIAGGTVACLGVPSVALPTLTCNKTISAANLDTDLGAVTGCYYVPGAGSFCNSGI